MVAWPCCAFSSKLNHDRNTWEIVYLMVPASQNDQRGEDSLNISFESIVPEGTHFLLLGCSSSRFYYIPKCHRMGTKLLTQEPFGDSQATEAAVLAHSEGASALTFSLTCRKPFSSFVHSHWLSLTHIPG